MVFDLTHKIEKGMTVYPESPAPEIIDLGLYEKYGVNVQQYKMDGHLGTHMDAPKHLFPDGADLSTLDISQFYGRAKVIDCSDHIINNKIEASVLNRLSDADESDFLIFYTGWDQYWGTEKYYSDFPVLSIELAEKIAGLKIKGIGVDVISVDPVGSEDLQVHKKILGSGKIIIENLANVTSVKNDDFTLACFPLKITGGDGSPIRAAAIVED